MVGIHALLLVADQTRAWELTESARSVLVGSICEVEVVNFCAKNAFFVTLLDVLCPQRAVRMDELV